MIILVCQHIRNVCLTVLILFTVWGAGICDYWQGLLVPRGWRYVLLNDHRLQRHQPPPPTATTTTTTTTTTTAKKTNRESPPTTNCSTTKSIFKTPPRFFSFRKVMTGSIKSFVITWRRHFGVLAQFYGDGLGNNHPSHSDKWRFRLGSPTKIYNDPAGDWVVVSNVVNIHPYLGKWSNLTNMFQMGWKHQLGWLRRKRFLESLKLSKAMLPRNLFLRGKLLKNVLSFRMLFSLSIWDSKLCAGVCYVFVQRDDYSLYINI